MAHSFGSDNHSGIHPVILEAIAEANTGHVPAYGADLMTAEAVDTVREVFSTDGDVLFVFNGTGANVLALRSITRSYNAVFCASSSHIWENECGAPEARTGCKFIPLPSVNGKIDPSQIEPYLCSSGDEHHNQPAAVSISQPTEYGTLYTIPELEELARFAHRNSLLLHVDGTRLANALAATGVDASRMITEAGVDVLSFGGTKNGMLSGECVVFVNDRLGEGAKYERKQLMQLGSKMRFTSAQFEAYLRDGLWIDNARRANDMARDLAELVSAVEGVEIPYPVETNMVFARVPERAVGPLDEAGYYCNVYPSDRCLVRWVCSFDTTAEDVRALAAALEQAVAGR